MDKAMQDVTLGTMGFAFASGTVGVAAGQTLRLSVVNLGDSDATVIRGWTSNPHPLSLGQDSRALAPGESWDSDLKDSDLSQEILELTGRAQIRAFVRSTSRTVCANLEVFDNDTRRTSIILPLQEVVQRE